MTHPQDYPRHSMWIDALGLPYLLRILGYAADPAKLVLGVMGILATLLLGAFLDLLWSAGNGIGENAIQAMSAAQAASRPFEEPKGDSGLFAVWKNHQTTAVKDLLAFSSSGSERTFAAVALVQGVLWLVRYHFVYFLLLAIGVLLIWSVTGGAMCRIAALQCTRDERPSLPEVWSYIRRNLIGGYFLAPFIPLGFVLAVSLLLILGGVFLRIPVLGDALGGAMFGLAIVGGFIVTLLLVGLLAGGSLMWPAVAAEGSDAFDAFSRSMSYVFSRIWKTIVYVGLAGLYLIVSWNVLQSFVLLALNLTRSIVAFGTSPFGWWMREVNGVRQSKLELIWPIPNMGEVHAWPQWSTLTWYESISAALVGMFVLLVVVFVWAFLSSFYFSASTVIYLLLRRDVDGTDMTDVHRAETSTPDAGPGATTSPETPTTRGPESHDNHPSSPPL